MHANGRKTRWRQYPRGAEAVLWAGDRGGERALYIVPGGLYLESVPLKDRRLIGEIRDRLTAYLESGSLRLPGEEAPAREGGGPVMSKRNREKRRAAGVQTCRADDGSTFEHREPPYAGVGSVNLTGHDPGIPGKVTPFERWECDGYYGTLRRYEDGLPTLPGGQPYGTGPCAIIGITADSETARHDWRAYQDIKNALVGDEWEAVELYPAESRKVDPSNRFYLFCFPKGVFTFGWGHRNVVAPRDGSAPQRGWLTRGDACPPRP